MLKRYITVKNFIAYLKSFHSSFKVSRSFKNGIYHNQVTKTIFLNHIKVS